MNPKTENTIRSILTLDCTIPEKQRENAIIIFRGDKIPCAPLPDSVRVLRFSEAAKRLNISRSTLKRYANRGLFDRVYGCGSIHAIGISLESYNRFISKQTKPHPTLEQRNRQAYDKKKLKASMRRADLERTDRKIRRLLGLASSSSQKQRYEAVKRVLDTTTNLSTSSVCKAAGITPSAYRQYLIRPKNPWDIQRKNQDVAILLIKSNIDVSKERVCLREAHRMITDHGIKVSLGTLSHILDKHGIARNRKGTKI